MPAHSQHSTAAPAYSTGALTPHIVASPRAALGAGRWHVHFSNTHGRVIVQLTLNGGGECCEVVPSKDGMRYALTIADALNRAYGIDPIEGFDVEAAFAKTPAPKPCPGRAFA